MNQPKHPMRPKDTDLFLNILLTMKGVRKEILKEKITNGKNLTQKEVLEKLKPEWEAYHFLRFAKKIENNVGKKELDDAFDNKGLGSLSTFRNMPSSGGITDRKSPTIFQLFAEIQGKSLLLCFVEFLEYCQHWNLPLSLYEESGNTGTLEADIQSIRKYIDELDQKNREKNKDYRFKSTILPAIENYFPRKYCEKTIDDFILKGQRNSGFILIEGDPGFGKTTLLAKIISDYHQKDKIECVWYFNKYGTDENTVNNFMEKIFEQLHKIYNLDEFKERYRNEIETGNGLRGSLFQDILKSISEQISVSKKMEQQRLPNLVIVVDALDEVNSSDPTVTGSCNTLNIPKEILSHIFFLISSRSFNDEVYNSPAKEKATIFLRYDQEHHQNDVKRYIRQEAEPDRIKEWIGKHSNGSVSDFVELLCEQSNYSFIYLHYVLKDIASYEEGILPRGIDGYYFTQLDRLLFKGDKEKKYLRTTLKKALAGIAFFDSISKRRLAYFCGLKDKLDIDEFIQDWLNIKIVKRDSRSKFFSFEHKSFYDYLKDSNKPECEQIRDIKKDTDLHGGLSEKLHSELDLKDDHIEHREYLDEFEKKETLKMILLAYVNGRKATYMSDLLTNHGFCAEVLKKNIHTIKHLICQMDIAFNLFKTSTTSEAEIAEFGNKMAKECYLNLIYSEPAIMSVDDFNLIFCERNTEFPYFFRINRPNE